MKPPKCPNCGRILEEVYEFGSFRKNWAWNKEKRLYEGSQEKWGDDITCRCDYCGTEIDNTFLLDHLEVTQE